MNNLYDYILEKKNNIPNYLKLFKEGENNMNNLYDYILENLMIIEDEEDPKVLMMVYAKIAGIVGYAFIKEDIGEEEATELMYMLKQNVYSCIDQLDS